MMINLNVPDFISPNSRVVQNAIGICKKAKFSEKISFPGLQCYKYR